MALDLTLLTPEQLDKFIHVQGIIWRQQLAAAKVRVLREYYDGEMPILLTDRQQEFIGKLLTEGEFEFTHNTIKSVIDTLRERLSVSGFTVNGAGVDDTQGNGRNQQGQTAESQLAALFWSWWEENRFDAQQIRLHRRAIRDGLSYVMVDYDMENKRPRFTLHSVDDGTTGITCHRDPENPDIVLYMCKYWYTYNPLKPGETGIQRKTVYLPNEIRKYIMGKGIWMRMDGVEAPFEEGDTVWPLPWVESDGTPLGIALKEFENPGGSEVAQIMGLQDALNKSWLDLIAAADAAGFPILVNEQEGDAPFIEGDDDEDIEGDDEFIVAPGRMIETTGHIHRIEGANLEQLIKVIELIVQTIAGVSRTPAYYLRPVGGSDVPSGESLKQLDSGLVKRAVERQLIFGQSWADIMALAYKVERTFGNSSLPDLPKLKVQTTWADPEVRNDLFESQTAEAHKRLNVPDEEIWTRLGYTPQQIQKFKATQRSDQAASTAAIVGAVQRAQTTQPRVTNTGNNNGNSTQGVPAVNGNGAR